MSDRIPVRYYLPSKAVVSTDPSRVGPGVEETKYVVAKIPRSHFTRLADQESP